MKNAMSCIKTEVSGGDCDFSPHPYTKFLNSALVLVGSYNHAVTCSTFTLGGSISGKKIDANFLTNTLLSHILLMFSTCGEGI